MTDPRIAIDIVIVIVAINIASRVQNPRDDRKLSFFETFLKLVISGDPDHAINVHDRTHAIENDHIDATKIENDPETRFNKITLPIRICSVCSYKIYSE